MASLCGGDEPGGIGWVLPVGVTLLVLFVVFWVVIIAATVLVKKGVIFRGRGKKKEPEVVANISRPLTG